MQTKITNKIASSLSKHLNANISVGKVDIGFFNKLYLEDVLIEDQNADTLLYSQFITARIDTLKIRKQRISIDELSFKNNQISLSQDSAKVFNFSFILNAIGQNIESDTLNSWNINCNQFDFNDLEITYKDRNSADNNELHVKDLNLDIADFHSIADSLSFKINQLNLSDGGNLNLESSSAHITINNGNIHLNELFIKSTHSEIENTELRLKLYNEADSMNTPFNLHLQVGKSNLSLMEFGELFPALDGMYQKVEFSGLVYGDLNDLKGKNVALSTEMGTQAILDFYINDLTKPENMYLFLDLKQLETSFSDISNFRFTNLSKIDFIEFPESFYDVGIINFKGNFSGFLTDFVTFGTLESEMGSLTTDILVTPEKGGDIYYRGNISTTDFKLGQFLNNDKLKNLTFSVSADGDYNKSKKSVSGIFKGNIKEIDFNRYTYENIKFDGILTNKMFDGLLSINDPNLQFVFLGELNMNQEIPRFDFNLDLKRALPSQLNLGKSFPNAEVAFNIYANFNGNNLDNLDGAISLKEGFYKNRNGQVNLGGMTLKSLPREGKNSFLFTSDFFDATIDGEYHFRTLLNAFQKTLNHFIPSINYKLAENTPPNSFNYHINIKDINRLSKVIVPGLEFETPFIFYGKIDSPNNDFQLEGSIPGIKYKNLWARSIFIGNQKQENGIYSSKFRINELFNRNGMKLFNFTIDSKISNNILDNVISWSNVDELTYSGNIKTQTVFSYSDSSQQQHIEIRGRPSQIYVADTLWSIAPFLATIDSASLAINNFKMSHNNQEFMVDGKIIEGNSDLINLKLKDIDLSYLDKYLNRDIELTGIINGTFGIANAIKEPVILSDIKVDALHYKNQFMGDISLVSRWNNFQSTIDSELKVTRNNRQNLKAFGYLKPSSKEIEFYTEVDSFSLIILETFMKKNFSDFKGVASGKVDIGGTLDKIALNGAVFAENAGLKINVTQIPYAFTDSIYFKNDTIEFDEITVFDDENNSGRFDGIMVHKNFKNMNFDLSFSSRKLRALNTTSRDNSQFYGTAIANGKLDITGGIKATKLTGTATTLPGTDIKISMESESTVEQYDFLEFVSTAETKKDDFFTKAEKEKSGEFDLSLTIAATPEAKVQLIYNSQIGDIIKAQGEGILLFGMDSEGNMSLSGNYNPTKGDYLFTLQNVLNKRFSIEQGGSIIWSGNPYNATIDLNAVYKLKASLYDILANQENNSQSQRIPVECIINLQDELINPTIGFGINFPSADESTKDKLSQFFNTEEEMNKQILSLIVMGKFYTPEYMRGSYEAQNANAIGSTASEMFSNQLSNWLSQISSNWDVGFNYRPGNQVTDDEIEVALSTQIFNDRVTLNGNIGNNVNQYGTNNSNSSQIVGDFEMSVKLVPSGKISFKAYNRSNNNRIYETAPYTQGIGLSFKEEYNSLDELVKKLGSLFKKNKK